jgi:hypothetical protein
MMSRYNIQKYLKEHTLEISKTIAPSNSGISADLNSLGNYQGYSLPDLSLRILRCPVKAASVYYISQTF